MIQPEPEGSTQGYPLVSVEVLRYDKRSKSENMRIVSTEMELILEHTQQGRSLQICRKLKDRGEVVTGPKIIKVEVPSAFAVVREEDDMVGKVPSPIPDLRPIEELLQAPTDRDSLNSAAGGNFLTKNTQEALTSIENKSNVQTSRNKPQVASSCGSSTQDPHVTALTKLKLSSLHLNNQLILYKRVVKLVVVHTFTTSVKPPMATLRTYTLLREPITRVVILINPKERPQGVLPSNTVPNPREDLKVITTRSGKANDGFLVGYAAHRKAYRVCNLSSKKVEETLNLRYLEDKPNVQGTHDTNIIAGTQDDDSESECDEQYGFEFFDATTEILHQAEIETRRNLVLAAGDPAGSIVSTGGVPAGSVLADSIPTSSVPAGSVPAIHIPTSSVPAGSVPASHAPTSSVPTGGVLAGSIDSVGFGDPAASGSIPTIFTTDHAVVSPFPSGHSLGLSEHSTRFPSPSDLGNHQPKAGIFSSSSYDDDFCADVTNLASNVAVDLVATKRILKNKRDARGIVVRNKSRLVAQGHRKEEGIDYDEVFAPVARIEAIRLFLAFASYMSIMVYQMDVKSAFLYGEIEEEVSMIGSLMYLTASRPDIMFAVSACSRHQVTPMTSHLNAVKKIFKYLKGKPHLVVATSCTEAEYVAAASCCGQALWIQNQMLDYGFNFMNTKIFIDNQSTICIVKNLVFHQRTKHIEIRHHFIRDANEKNLIQFSATATVQNHKAGPSEIIATIDGNEVVVNESLIRTQLQLNDVDGLYKFTLHDVLDRMREIGYPKDGSLTFYKAKLSPQWRFLIHTLIHCMSPKSGGWNQFPSSIASDGPHMPLLAPMLVVPAGGDGAAAVAASAAAAHVIPPPPPPPIVPLTHSSSSTPGPSTAAQATPVREPSPVREPTPLTEPTPVREPTPSPVREPTPFWEPTPDSPRPPSPPPYPRLEEVGPTTSTRPPSPTRKTSFHKDISEGGGDKKNQGELLILLYRVLESWLPFSPHTPHILESWL
nr:hypothetical protein [Tanacetum cinerariifolium]